VKQFYENRINPSHKVINKLNNFLASNNLIIKEADKNLGLTVMDFIWYNTQILKHLRSSTYVAENHDPRRIISELEDMLKTCTSIRINFDKLRNRKFVVPKLYIPPKIHKKPVSSRPIVHNYDRLTTKTSIWLHAKLWPYVEQIDWIAKNSLEIVHNLNKTIFTEPPLI
jgi:hypothetical protein